MRRLTGIRLKDLLLGWIDPLLFGGKWPAERRRLAEDAERRRRAALAEIAAYESDWWHRLVQADTAGEVDAWQRQAEEAQQEIIDGAGLHWPSEFFSSMYERYAQHLESLGRHDKARDAARQSISYYDETRANACGSAGDGAEALRNLQSAEARLQHLLARHD
jgi:hypothetical protein